MVHKAVSKRARKRASEFSRDEILDAARMLFLRQGYEAVTVRKIAAAIGCAPGTIYLHFADKGEIFESLCSETFQKLSARLAAIAGDDDDPLECVRRGGRAYIAFALEHPGHYVITFLTQKKGSGKDRDADILDAGLQCFGNLRRMVTRCSEAGCLRVNHVDEVSQVIWSFLHGLVSLLITHGEFPFVEQSRLVERHLDILIAGIRA
jgi:AcrR family transcriptional regulator